MIGNDNSLFSFFKVMFRLCAHVFLGYICVKWICFSKHHVDPHLSCCILCIGDVRYLWYEKFKWLYPKANFQLYSVDYLRVGLVWTFHKITSCKELRLGEYNCSLANLYTLPNQLPYIIKSVKKNNTLLTSLIGNIKITLIKSEHPNSMECWP